MGLKVLSTFIVACSSAEEADKLKTNFLLSSTSGI